MLGQDPLASLFQALGTPLAFIFHHAGCLIDFYRQNNASNDKHEEQLFHHVNHMFIIVFSKLYFESVSRRCISMIAGDQHAVKAKG